MRMLHWIPGIALLLAAPAGLAEQEGTNATVPSPLVNLVRDATARFRDVATAVSEGYEPFLGCASGRDEGAMGIHYVNGDLLGDGALDPRNPESLVYEPQRNGRLRLVAVEYITFADAWNAENETAPVLEGHVLHLTGEPNRYGIPAHFELHVWAWQRNPVGTFADWNPLVSCDAYDPARHG